MNARWEVTESAPGLLRGTMHGGYRHVDGDIVLTVAWSEDDQCWVARYADDQVTSCIGTGNSVQAALAHFCGALRCELLAWKTEYERSIPRADKITPTGDTP